jgi:hypothetical protein
MAAAALSSIDWPAHLPPVADAISALVGQCDLFSGPVTVWFAESLFTHDLKLENSAIRLGHVGTWFAAEGRPERLTGNPRFVPQDG